MENPYVTLYATDYATVPVTEDEAALLMAADYIYQRPNTNDNLSYILRRAAVIRSNVNERGKAEWHRSRPAYFWLGVEADNG